MTANTDFIEMFHELGVSANCTMAEFRLAYRRCVAQLHPDRAGGEVADQSRLQRLTVMYEAALDFHRRHGRLPGYATQPSAPPANATPPPASDTASPPRTARSRLRYLLALLALAILVWMLWEVPPPVDGTATEDPDAPAAFESAPAAAADPAAHRLMLGMTKDEVRAIEGDPVSSSDTQWDYGPSWISFKCDEVDDWYSSPLLPLRFARHQHPTASDSPATPNHPPGCVDVPPH
jgi:hypothetical protein